jgi:hypothetical protein
VANRFLKRVASKTRPALFSLIAVASVMLAAVFCVFPASAQTGDAFTLAPLPGTTAEPVSSRQFDSGYGITFTDGSVPVAGTSTYPCQIGFKFNAANNGLTRTDINRTTSTPEWRTMVRGIIGVLFSVTAERPVTVQGYRGIELSVTPRSGPGSANVRGLMTMVETPKGRMTSVCMTSSAAFSKAAQRFRALPRSATLPE